MSTPSHHALSLLAQRLTLLRGFGIGLSAALLVLAQHLNLTLPYPNLVLMTFAWLIMHGGVLIFQKHRQPNEQQLLLQLASDLLVVAGLLAFSGGVHNPFFALLLLPLLLGVGILSRQSQWLLLSLVLIFSTLLVWFPLSSAKGMPSLPPDLYHLLFILDGTRVTDTPFNPRDSLAKLGLWLNLSLIAILIALMLSKLHQRLQDQRLALEAAYRQQQEQTHLLQLGLTAAATAHELATPLATISLLASEVKDAYSFDDVDAAEQALDQIQQLVQTCKQHIHRGLGQQPLTQDQHLLAYPDYLKQQISYWLYIRPQAQARLTTPQDNKEIPKLIPSPQLSQILITLLNNAADASHDHTCDVILKWNAQAVIICIRDIGNGFDHETLVTFPAPQISQKPDGHGIGLSLAYHQAQQLGGSLALHNLTKGAEVILTLPHRQNHELP